MFFVASVVFYKGVGIMQGVGKTDIGKNRTNNEDCIYVSNSNVGALANLYVVADGMGGHAYGEVASSKAVEFFCKYFTENSNFVYKEDYMQEALAYANKEIFAKALSEPSMLGMGTTFTAVTLDNQNLYYAHVGDSRLYVLKTTGELLQITKDHSLVHELTRDGIISLAQAETHPDKNVLTRAVGTEEHVKIDKGFYPLNDAEKILLCSDGLTNMLSDADILSLISSDMSLADIVAQLLHNANDNGGIDNISVILIGR